MGFTPEIDRTETKRRFAPVYKVFAFPYKEAFAAAGGVIVVFAFVQQNLRVADAGDVGDNHKNLLSNLHFTLFFYSFKVFWKGFGETFLQKGFPNNFSQKSE
jgi:hypothetical protein